MKNLIAMRAEIDKVDEHLVALLAQRFQLTERVGLYKAEKALQAKDLVREANQFKRYASLAKQHDLSEAMVNRVFETIIQEVILRHNHLIN